MLKTSINFSYPVGPACGLVKFIIRANDCWKLCLNSKNINGKEVIIKVDKNKNSCFIDGSFFAIIKETGKAIKQGSRAMCIFQISPSKMPSKGKMENFLRVSITTQ